MEVQDPTRNLYVLQDSEKWMKASTTGVSLRDLRRLFHQKTWRDVKNDVKVAYLLQRPSNVVMVAGEVIAADLRTATNKDVMGTRRHRCHPNPFYDMMRWPEEDLNHCIRLTLKEAAEVDYVVLSKFHLTIQRVFPSPYSHTKRLPTRVQQVSP